MKLIPIILLGLWAGAAGSQSRDSEEIYFINDQAVRQSVLDQHLDQLIQAYKKQIFSEPFRAHLQPQSQWQKQLAFAVLMGYPDGPGSAMRAGPGAYVFETQLESAIEAAPNELAPRVLMLAHCEQLQLESPEACYARHADALIAYHPDNAAGYLYRAQLALRDDDELEAARWMTLAGQRVGFNPGHWSIVQVLFRVFQQAEVVSEDSLNLGDMARMLLAEGTVAHLSLDRKTWPAYRCQQATAEPLLSGCLAAARALKLPGTSQLLYRLGLAIEEKIYHAAGDEKALTQVRLERGGLKLRGEELESVKHEMHEHGGVAQVLDSWVRFGELDTQIDRALTAAHNRSRAGGSTGLPILKPSHDARLACLDRGFPDGAPECVTREMMEAEFYRIGEVFEQLIRSEEFRQRLAADPSAPAQLMAFMLESLVSGSAGDSSQPSIDELVARFPGYPSLNRVAIEHCKDDPACWLQAADRLMAYEPDNALGYLLAGAAYLERGSDHQAITVFNQLDQATRLRGGFALFTYDAAQVFERHVGPATVSDPLGVWELFAPQAGFGFAAALAMPWITLGRSCLELHESALRAGCHQAASAMTLPGATVMETLVGLKTLANMAELSGDTEALNRLVDQIAEVEDLRDSMDHMNDQLLFNPEAFSHYIRLLIESGEIAAIRWIVQQPVPATRAMPGSNQHYP